MGIPYLRVMPAADLFIKIQSLPEDLQKQVQDFVDFLLQRKKDRPQQEKKRIAGLMKGQIHIADDFDAPLDDFKEYME